MEASNDEKELVATKPPLGLYIQPGGPHGLTHRFPIWGYRVVGARYPQVLVSIMGSCFWLNVESHQVLLQKESISQIPSRLLADVPSDVDAVIARLDAILQRGSL